MGYWMICEGWLDIAVCLVLWEGWRSERIIKATGWLSMRDNDLFLQGCIL